VSRYALRLRDVDKRYGCRHALRGLTFDVPRGSVTGLIGPNGAGKTTTFGVVAGTVRPDAGSVDVLGLGAPDPMRTRGRVALLPQDCALPGAASARQLLRFYGTLAGATRAEAARDAERVLDAVRLTDRGDARVRELSHGMKRRLAVAQALLGQPELVLLDEPTGGLDPHLVIEMRELLRRQAGARTLVVSSHVLSDLEATCDHLVFLEAGRCLREASLEELAGRVLRVCLAAEPTGTLPDLGRPAERVGDELRLPLGAEESVEEVNRVLLPRLLEAGVPVREVRVGVPLEDAYLALRGEIP
jgi:ABC-2 type transport system ATP-binding protein